MAILTAAPAHRHATWVSMLLCTVALVHFSYVILPKNSDHLDLHHLHPTRPSIHPLTMVRRRVYGSRAIALSLCTCKSLTSARSSCISRWSPRMEARIPPSASPLPPTATPPLLETLRPHCRCLRRRCKRLRLRRHRLQRRCCRRAEHRTAAANWHQPSSLDQFVATCNSRQHATAGNRLFDWEENTRTGQVNRQINFRLTSINPQYGITTSDQAIHTVAGA